MTAIDTNPFGRATLAPVAPVKVATDATTDQVAAIGYLRTFVTLLVLAHHAVLAYHPYVPLAASSLTALPTWWQAFPIGDPQKWPGIELFTGLNDVFFMSLMFFLSGLFVWTSLERKGIRTFLRDRVLRLGLPFAIAALVIAPLAYYPAYLATGATPSLVSYAQQWLSVGNWTSGPLWFIWLLLAFDVVAAVLFALWPRWVAACEPLLADAARRPLVFFGGVLAASAAAYVPLALLFDPARWMAWGPFAFQPSRLIQYLAYFLIGAAVGGYGVSRGLLARDGNLARRWWLWVVAALVIFGLSIGVTIAALVAQSTSPVWTVIGGITFVLVCGATSFAYLAVFVRFGQRRFRLFDSLRDNAYGMYLIHYLFVTWLQLALLHALLPGAAKGTLVFLGVVALSWAVSAALRRIPAVASVI